MYFLLFFFYFCAYGNKEYVGWHKMYQEECLVMLKSRKFSIVAQSKYILDKFLYHKYTITMIYTRAR